MVSALSFQHLLVVLIIQGLLGAFDSFWNHEWKERLPSRPTALEEQRLHSLREFIYVVLFAGMAWTSWDGLWAWVFAALLIVETIITGWDFVIEDKTRVLSPVERLTHALITLGYGAFLAWFAPYLWEWSQRPTGFTFHDYGVISWILTAFSIGVLLLASRNLISTLYLAKLRRAGFV